MREDDLGGRSSGVKMMGHHHARQMGILWPRKKAERTRPWPCHPLAGSRPKWLKKVNQSPNMSPEYAHDIADLCCGVLPKMAARRLVTLPSLMKRCLLTRPQLHLVPELCSLLPSIVLHSLGNILHQNTCCLFLSLCRFFFISF